MSRSDIEEANTEVELILAATKPKHLGEGLASGVGYILRGAVGACGALILMPAVGAAEGRREGGIMGGIAGGAGGMLAGVVHGANVLGGGIVSGVGQVVRGVAATPAAVVAPSRGMWWNSNEGRWVKTYLLEDERWVKAEPEHDEDILGDEALPEAEREASGSGHSVKDDFYYSLLGVDADASADQIKRRYYIIARKFSPDRAGANPDAQKQFQEIGKAYTILMNPDLRAKYDRVGRDGLWKEEVEPPDVDPFVLYSVLFGSEKFDDYIGRLAAVSSARVGDEANSRITMEKARLLQKRRVTRLALLLAERLAKWAEDRLEAGARADWMAEAESLCDASFGLELVNVIGKVYELSACQFLGSLTSGVGMPSIRNWAKKQTLCLKHGTKRNGKKIISVGGKKEELALHRNVGTAIEKSEGDEELEEVAMEVLKNSNLKQTAIDLLWQQTVLDITNTLHEAAQMVLHDQNVTPEIRKARAEGLEVIGVIFGTAQRPEGVSAPEDQEELENVAFHAVLDTVWRQEMSSRSNANPEADD